MAVANPVLFELSGSAWTLGGVLIVLSLVGIVVWACTVPLMTRRIGGYTRKLDADEAASLALSGHEQGAVRPEVIAHGPAVGAEARFEFSIGDLRKAWQEKRYGYYFGVPAYWSTFMLCIALLGTGAALVKNMTDIALIVLGIVGFFESFVIFAMWAAVFTKLE
ncbi:MAG: hypothetical protein ABW321_20310 [Polyangiales bacterium]